MIAFSLDIDWAPEEVIQDSLELFELYKIKCTLFSTHDSKVIRTSNKDLFEVGIHPNFNNLINGLTKEGESATKIIKDLMEIYPEAKGVRSHSMTQSSRLLSLFKENGLEYDSNQFLPYNWEIKPYECWTGIKRIPYNWEDDVHFAYKKKFNFFFNRIFDVNKNFIFDFHPIHIYLNTDSELTYLNAKPFYHNPYELLKKRNNIIEGTRDFLINLFEFINLNKLETKKMIEI